MTMLIVEEDEQETLTGRKVLVWRWTCSCKAKGNWQDLSFNNAANGGRAHLADVHALVLQPR